MYQLCGLRLPRRSLSISVRIYVVILTCNWRAKNAIAVKPAGWRFGSSVDHPIRFQCQTVRQGPTSGCQLEGGGWLPIGFKRVCVGGTHLSRRGRCLGVRAGWCTALGDGNGGVENVRPCSVRCAGREVEGNGRPNACNKSSEERATQGRIRDQKGCGAEGKQSQNQRNRNPAAYERSWLIGLTLIQDVAKRPRSQRPLPEEFLRRL